MVFHGHSCHFRPIVILRVSLQAAKGFLILTHLLTNFADVHELYFVLFALVLGEPIQNVDTEQAFDLVTLLAAFEVRTLGWTGAFFFFFFFHVFVCVCVVESVELPVTSDVWVPVIVTAIF